MHTYKSLVLALAFTLAGCSGSGAAEKVAPASAQGRDYSALFEQGAAGTLPVEATDEVGRPVLVTAILHGSDAEVRALIEQGFDPESQFMEFPALLFTVSEQCMAEKLATLIEKGADVDSHEKGSGSTAIHLAAQHSDARCLQLLVDSGADVNAVDNLGRSAFFYAVENGSDTALNLLSESGADPFIQSRDGLDVFRYAILLDRADLIKPVLLKSLN